MKKVRNIKIIKSGVISRDESAPEVEEASPQPANKKSRSAMVIQSWVQEHLEEKQRAEKSARNLLKSPVPPAAEASLSAGDSNGMFSNDLPA
jgi:hypothetical protein